MFLVCVAVNSIPKHGCGGFATDVDTAFAWNATLFTRGPTPTMVVENAANAFRVILGVPSG